MAAGVEAPFEFLLSGVREEHEHGHEEKEIMTKIRALGGRAQLFSSISTTYDVSKCTHVISCIPTRNEIFEMVVWGVASGKWILKPEFIRDSFARCKWQAESMYEWSEGDVLENVPSGFLTAPRRWREKIAASGQGAFHGWNVLLHVTNPNLYAVCRRVLEAGGGQCVPVTFPIKELAGLVSLVTHVIVEKCYEKDIQCLEARGIPCLLPEFIVEHLFQENPNMTQFHVSSALITPPEAMRQRNTEAPTKKDHDTFLNPTPRTRSQAKQANPSGRERDIPGSTMSRAEEGTSSDPGRGVKRELPNQLREPLQILKKRKRKDPKGETPLHIACRNNDIDKVRKLLNEPDIDVNARDNAEWTPLHEACNHGSTACVKELLVFSSGKRKITNSGTESRSMQTLDLLAAPSECGTTPLHDAVFNNHIEVVKLLVEAGGGSLLTVKNKAGFTPVDMALLKPGEVMKEAILGQRSEVSRLPAGDEENENNSGTESRSMQTLDLLAAPSECGTTSLHDAVNNNQIEEVKLLVEAGGGSLLTFENNAGFTPVDVAQTEVMEEAILSQRSEVIRLLADDEENENRISDSYIMPKARIKHNCTQCPYSSKRSHDLKRHFSRIHGKGQSRGHESLPARATPIRNAEKEKGQQEVLRKRGVTRRIVSSDNDSSESVPDIFINRPSHSRTPNDKPKTEKTRIGPNPNGDSKKKKIVHKNKKEVESYARDAKKCNGSLINSSLNEEMPEGETPLHVACRNNNITKLRELLNVPDIDVDARDHAEWTPLHEACKHGHTACVKELLKFTSEKRKITNSGTENKVMQTLELLAAPSECGTTPLHDAVYTNHIEVVKLLVEAGVSCSIIAHHSPRSSAKKTNVNRKNRKVSCSIIAHPSSRSSPRKTNVNRKNRKVSCGIIAHQSPRSSPRKTNVNRKNRKVSHSTIAHPSPKSSAKKTNVNHKDHKGETQLHIACRNNDIDKVTKLLNEPDIDVNARDHAEWTPLHEACNHGSTACVKELLKFTPGKRKITSTESKVLQTLDLLAAPSECGTTSLHDAVFNDQIEVVKLLVEAGGRSLLTVKNKAGFTPVDMALLKPGEDMKEAILGQRSEVSRLPAGDEENENNASTSKAAKDRSNTKVKDRSRETPPSSKPNLGKDEGSAMDCLQKTMMLL